MIRTLALCGLTLLAACSNGNGEEDAGDPVALVSLGTAQRGRIAQSATLYGAVEHGAEAQFTLAAPAEARLTGVAAPAGTRVRRGQLVVALTPSPAVRAQIVSAQSADQAAQQALARAKRLRADGLASDADVESARQAAETASASRQSLTRQAGAMALRAPEAGYVESIAANPGDLVAAGTAVATLARTGALRARFGILPAAARALPAGGMLRVAPSEGGAPFTAPILSVDPSIDPQTRLVSVYVRVPAAQRLGPGQPLTATVPVRQARDAVTIPYAALLDDGGQPYVFVVLRGVAHRHDVATGPSSGDRIAIERGVAAGDRVVTQGGTAVEDGMKVRTR